MSLNKYHFKAKVTTLNYTPFQRLLLSYTGNKTIHDSATVRYVDRLHLAIVCTHLVKFLTSTPSY